MAKRLWRLRAASNLAANGPRPRANANDHRGQCRPILEGDSRAIDGRCSLAQMKNDTMFLVDSTNEFPKVAAENAFERSAFRRHDMDLYAPRAQ